MPGAQASRPAGLPGGTLNSKSVIDDAAGGDDCGPSKTSCLTMKWDTKGKVVLQISELKEKLRNKSMAKTGRPKLDKFGVAAALQEIAVLMELKGGNYRFKAKAYNAGARSIQAVANLDKLVAEDTLTSLPRIGEASASQIKELYLTGESSVLKGLKQEFPAGLAELSKLGLSIPKIKQLQEELGVTSVAELKAAAEVGKVRNIKGFGAKTEQRLLETIAGHKAKPKQHLYLHHALSTGERIIEYLQTLEGVVDVSFAGPLRRLQETVATIDIVVSAKKPLAILKHFEKFPMILSSQSEGNELNAELADGVSLSLTVVTPQEFAATLFLKTGSNDHLAKLGKVTDVSKVSSGSAPKSEEEIYRRLKLQYIPPELREDQGEVEAAREKKLPDDLLEVGDIKGMVHCHTTYSDGKHSIEAMVLAAESMGMKYITITDHSPTASYAGGVTVDRLKRQWDEIAEVQERVKIKILRGTESDIVASGKLDYPDGILEQFDVIVASIHARYKMDKQRMTERIITAMREPVFKIWGHALGRLLQRRPAFECDVARVLDVIAESRAAIEINGDPYRLDLEPRWVREARKRKIKFVISVDAHSTGALNNVKFGVAMARRGWVTKSEVLNALPVNGFTKAVRPAG